MRTINKREELFREGNAVIKKLKDVPVKLLFALSFVVLNDLSLNLLVQPSRSAYPSYAGFGATLAQLICFALLTLALKKKPKIMVCGITRLVALVLFIIGAFLIALGYSLELAAFTLVGWLLASAGTVCVVVLVGLAFTYVRNGLLFFSVMAAFVMVYFFASLCFDPLLAMHGNRYLFLALYVSTFLLALCLLCCCIKSVLSRVVKESLDLAFRPLADGSRGVLIIILFALGVVNGYASFVVFGTRASAGVSFASVACAIIALALISRRMPARYDVVFHFALLLVLAGLLVMPFLTQVHGGERVALLYVSNTLLAAGSVCFSLLSWLVLISWGSQSPPDALRLFSCGGLARAGGTLGGLVVGVMASSLGEINSLIPDVVAVVLAFVLVTYALVGLKRFSFEERLVAADALRCGSHGLSTRPSEDALAAQAMPLQQHCHDLALQKGLTSRETQILHMIARGRSNPFIAQELTISQNTVKTHVKHIYAKLGVHSQQDIIDLVERMSFSQL